MMSEHSQQNRLSGGELTLSAEGFPARTLVTPESEPASRESEADCGQSSIGSFAQYDQESSSWKTCQRCLSGELEEFLGIWPRVGSMQLGKCFRHPTSEPRINAKGFLCSRTEGTGFLTPSACDGNLGLIVMQARLGALMESGQPLKRADGGEYQAKPLELYLARAIASGELTMEAALGERWIIRPNFHEWLMGFPIGWTDCMDSETPLSPKSQNGSADA